jgi:predicted nucleic acid-binding Zn ribbon protein
MSDEPLKVCPECQGVLKKVVYPTGVVFKGSGFYTTDYKGSGSKASGNGSSSSSSSDGASSSKSETKADSKSESKSGSDD